MKRKNPTWKKIPSLERDETLVVKEGKKVVEKKYMK